MAVQSRPLEIQIWPIDRLVLHARNPQLRERLRWKIALQAGDEERHSHVRLAMTLLTELATYLPDTVE